MKPKEGLLQPEERKNDQTKLNSQKSNKQTAKINIILNFLIGNKIQIRYVELLKKYK
jgi:hypothetical protein